MSIIKNVTLQKIVAHDFRYDPRTTFRTRRKFEIKSRVRCLIHFVRSLIVSAERFVSSCAYRISLVACRKLKTVEGLRVIRNLVVGYQAFTVSRGAAGQRCKYTENFMKSVLSSVE